MSLLGARQPTEYTPVSHPSVTRRSATAVVVAHAAATYPFMTPSSEIRKATAHAAGAPRSLKPPSETHEATARAAAVPRSLTYPWLPAPPRATLADLTFRPPTRSSKIRCWTPESCPPPEPSAIVSSARYSVSRSATPSRLRHSTDAPAHSPP